MSDENKEQQLNEKQPAGGNDDKLQAEILNAQKQRQRAQAAEAELEKIKAEQEKVRQAKLVENEEFQTVIGEQNAELETLRKRDAEYSAEQKARRKLLLDKVPDDQQEFVEAMSLPVLEKYVAKQTPPDTGKPPGAAGTKKRSPEGLPDRYIDCTTSQQKRDWLAAHK